VSACAVCSVLACCGVIAPGLLPSRAPPRAAQPCARLSRFGSAAGATHARYGHVSAAAPLCAARRGACGAHVAEGAVGLRREGEEQHSCRRGRGPARQHSMRARSHGARTRSPAAAADALSERRVITAGAASGARGAAPRGSAGALQRTAKRAARAIACATGERAAGAWSAAATRSELLQACNAMHCELLAGAGVASGRVWLHARAHADETPHRSQRGGVSEPRAHAVC
jgi:hypothetical protein